MMRYGSICSGIEAATVAWHPLGWQPVFFAEIEKFPSAVLKHRWPEVPNLGDFTKIKDEHGAIDLLVGGTPCQDFSVAGLRAGMAGARGQLTIEFTRLAERLRPRWLVWENVPGVLSSDGGRAFGMFLGLLGQLGYGFAYRVLDAQYCGVAQRRRRVFVVGHLGDWRRAAAVLFERQSLSGHPPPRRKAGQGAPTIPARSTAGGGLGTDFDCDGGLVVPEVARCLSTSNERIDWETETFVAHALHADGFDASEDGSGRGTPLVPIAFTAKDHGADALDGLSPTLRAGGFDKSHANAGVMPAIAIQSINTPREKKQDGIGVSEADVMYSMTARDQHAVAFESRFVRNGRGAPGDIVPPLKAQSGGSGKGDAAPLTLQGMSVRRLTPRECERLQGFPDDWTLVPYRGCMAADGNRYKALGNSMAVPVMRWIGERIEMVELLAPQSCP